MTILMEQQVWEKISLVTTVDQSINLSLPSSSQRARHGPSHEIYLLTEVQHKRRRMNCFYYARMVDMCIKLYELSIM